MTIISPARLKRLERYAEIREQFNTLHDGTNKSAVVIHLTKEFKASSATIYKAIK